MDVVAPVVDFSEINDVEVAALLDIPVGEPMADVRRVLVAPDRTVIYLAEVNYRGDYIHLDMNLKP
jgi:GntR family transcriptional regulator